MDEHTDSLKLYILDYGWSGADMIVTDSDDEARSHFVGGNLEHAKEGLRLHMENHPKQLNPWHASIEYWSGKFWDDVVAYPIVKGLTLNTVGDN